MMNSLKALILTISLSLVFIGVGLCEPITREQMIADRDRLLADFQDRFKGPNQIITDQQLVGMIKKGLIDQFLLNLKARATGDPSEDLTALTQEAEDFNDKLSLYEHQRDRKMKVETQKLLYTAKTASDLAPAINELSQTDFKLDTTSQSLLNLLTKFRTQLNTGRSEHLEQLGQSYGVDLDFVPPASPKTDQPVDDDTTINYKKIDAIVDRFLDDRSYSNATTSLAGLKSPLLVNESPTRYNDQPQYDSGLLAIALRAQLSAYQTFSYVADSATATSDVKQLTDFIDACHCSNHVTPWTARLRPLERELVAKFIANFATLQDYPAIDAKTETVAGWLRRILSIAQERQNWNDASRILYQLHYAQDSFNATLTCFQNADAESCGHYCNAKQFLSENRINVAINESWYAIRDLRTQGPRSQAIAFFHRLSQQFPGAAATSDLDTLYFIRSVPGYQYISIRDQWAKMILTDN